jgi:hypothetical protein
MYNVVCTNTPLANLFKILLFIECDWVRRILAQEASKKQDIIYVSLLE